MASERTSTSHGSTLATTAGDSTRKAALTDYCNGTSSALLYCCVSIGLTLFNKAIMSTYGFRLSTVLVLCQSIVQLSVLLALKRAGFLAFEDLRQAVAWRVLPLSFVFVFYVVVSLLALDGTSIPMFMALRRTTIVLVMILEWLLLGQLPSRPIALTAGVMVVGAVIAASSDLTFNPAAYIQLLLTNASTALYMVFISRVRRDTGISVLGLLVYNNVLTLPALFLVALSTGELGAAVAFDGFKSPSFLIVFSLSMLMACLMNVASFVSTSLNSASTQNVIGQMKNMIVVLASLMAFSDYKYDEMNMIGLLIGFGGGMAYGYVRLREKEAPTAGQAEPPTAKARELNGPGSQTASTGESA